MHTVAYMRLEGVAENRGSLEVVSKQRDELERWARVRAYRVQVEKGFEQSTMSGLQALHKGSQSRMVTPAVQARLKQCVQQKPSHGSTHWSCRKLATALDLSKTTVQRVLQTKLNDGCRLPGDSVTRGTPSLFTIRILARY